MKWKKNEQMNSQNQRKEKKRFYSISSSCNLTHLFLEFWLVNTWFFVPSRDLCAVTCLKNVHQLNIRLGKKLSLQLYIHNLYYADYVQDE